MFTMTEYGFVPQVGDATTVSVAVSIIEQVLLSRLTTNNFVPSGVSADSLGLSPTVMVAVTVFDAIVMTLTLSPSGQVTYAFVLLGKNETNEEPVVVLGVATTVSVAVLIIETVLAA